MTTGNKRKTPAEVKKLSVKKETVKDLKEGKELGDDELGGVAGGQQNLQVFRSAICRMSVLKGCPPPAKSQTIPCAP